MGIPCVWTSGLRMPCVWTKELSLPGVWTRGWVFPVCGLGG